MEIASRVLDIATLGDRIAYSIAMVNIYRLLQLFVELAPPFEQRVKLQVPIERLHGTSVIVHGATAVKRIEDCDEVFKKFGNSLSAVQVRFYSNVVFVLVQAEICCKVCVKIWRSAIYEQNISRRHANFKTREF